MLEKVVLGNTLFRWLVAIGVAAGVFVLFAAAKRFLCARLVRYTHRTAREWDDGLAEVVCATKYFFLAIFAAFLGAKFLHLPPKEAALVYRIVFLAFIAQVAVWGSALIAFGVDYLGRAHPEDGARRMTVRAVGFLVKLAFFAIVVLWALDNLGVNITALVAGLGVGGVAIALATQNILGDLFASLSIVLDKPFVLGDFIVVGDVMGNIENIGLKTTRLRSLSGEEIVVSNGDLLQSRIHNYKRMRVRRIEFRFTVAPETPVDVLGRISPMVKELILKEKEVRFDRSHFKEIKQEGPVFEAVYIVQTDDFNRYMDIQERLNLGICRGLEALGTRPAVQVQRTWNEAAPLIPANVRAQDTVPRAPRAVSPSGAL